MYASASARAGSRPRVLCFPEKPLWLSRYLLRYKLLSKHTWRLAAGVKSRWLALVDASLSSYLTGKRN